MFILFQPRLKNLFYVGSIFFNKLYDKDDTFYDIGLDSATMAERIKNYKGKFFLEANACKILGVEGKKF